MKFLECLNVGRIGLFLSPVLMRHAKKAITLLISTSLVCGFIPSINGRSALGQSKAKVQSSSEKSNSSIRQNGQSEPEKDLIQRGTQQFEQQEFRAAIASFQQAKQNLPKLNTNEQAQLFDYLGQSYIYIDESEEAAKNLKKSLEIHRNNKDKSKIAATLVNLAWAYKDDLGKNAPYSIEALKLYEELEDQAGLTEIKYIRAFIFPGGASLYRANGSRGDLKKYYELLDLMQTMKSVNGEGKTLLMIGEAHMRSRSYSRSLSALKKALAIFQSEADFHHQIITLWAMGDVYRFLGELPQSIETYEAAIDIAKNRQHIDLEISVQIALAKIMTQKGQRQEAITLFKEMLALTQKFKKKNAQKELLETLGDIYKEDSKKEIAIKYFRDLELIKHKEEGRDCKSNQQTALGEVYRSFYSEDDDKRALELFQEALAIEQKHHRTVCEILVLNFLIDRYRSEQEWKKILDLTQRVLEMAKTLPKEQILMTFNDRQISHFNRLMFSITSIEDFSEVAYPKEIEEIFQTVVEIGQVLEEPWIIEDSYFSLSRYYKRNGDSNRESEYSQGAFKAQIERQDFSCKEINKIAKGLYHSERNPIKTDADDAVQAIAALNSALDLNQKSKQWRCRLFLINQLNGLYLGQRNFDGISEMVGQANDLLSKPKPRKDFRNSSELTDLTRFLKGIAPLEKIASFFKDGKVDDSTTQKVILFYQSIGEISEALKDSTINESDLQLEVIEQFIRILKLEKQYQAAIDLLESGLDNANKQTEKIYFLNELGDIHDFVGNYEKAIRFYKERLILQYQSGDLEGERDSLFSLADNYFKIGNFDKAIDSSQQIIDLIDNKQKNPTFFESHDPVVWQLHKSLPLLVIARSYAAQRKFELALRTFQDNLDLIETLKGMVQDIKSEDRQTTSTSSSEGSESKDYKRMTTHLNDLEKSILLMRGEIYYSSGDIDRSLADYQESDSLNNILSYLGFARIYRDTKFPTVAIAYYKHVVSRLEKEREKIQTLPEELQASYLNASFDLQRTPVADIYRELADLLISLGRIAEAQEILELLKLQELNDFTEGTRAESILPDLNLNSVEQDIIQQHQSLSQFGEKLQQCEINDCSDLSMLRDQQEQLKDEFDQKIRTIETNLKDRRLEQISDGTLDFTQSAQKLVKSHPDSMLIYPLVLKDKTRLLWATEGGVFSTQTCPLGESEIWAAIAEFRRLLSTPESELAAIKTTGNELYDCFIKPLESEIAASQIKHLIFVPDRATNYIPMAALFDGQQFLAENYVTSSVLSAALTDVSDRLPETIEETSTLALGVSKAVGGFNPLPNVSKELDAIVKEDKRDQGIYPGLALLDQKFAKNTLRDSLKDQKILHIATHGKFIPDDPRASYLLTGTGEKLPIHRLQVLENLRNVHLVVLSACETALGGPDQNGVEVAGISSYFLQDRAKAVLASLWQVNDKSTNQLMQVFYRNLSASEEDQPITKGEALRRAQVSLLTGEDSSLGQHQRGRVVIRDQKAPKGQQASQSFSHPYYWAPFTLIGNSR